MEKYGMEKDIIKIIKLNLKLTMVKELLKNLTMKVN